MTVNVRPPDAAHRELAISKLDHNMLVMAGAGTGKTTLLIDRLTFLLLGLAIPVEKIVALTFTKKAAEEMRERLEERLNKVVAGTFNDELLESQFPEHRQRWQELAEKALTDIPKSQIGTIHSFAGHLLRLYPLQAGVDPAFREDEGAALEILFEKQWKAWLAEELADHSPRHELWVRVLKQADLPDVREIAQALASPMVDLEALSKKTDTAPLLDEARRALTEIQMRYPAAPKAKMFNAALAWAGLVLSRKTVALDDESFDQLKRLDSPPTGWENAKAQLKNIKTIVKAAASIDEKLFHDVLSLVGPFARHVRGEANRLGIVSFDGLLVFARDLVRDHADVRHALKKRFATFLVDEFQDTDPLQGEILFYLAEEARSSARRWQDVKLEPGRLFVVGDPKQSIYRFRGADIAAFESFEDHMLKQGALAATLSANFRSRSAILDCVNDIFSKAMIESKYRQPPYAALEAGGEEPHGVGPASVQIVSVAPSEEGEDDWNAERSREAEAAFVAEWIKENVRAPLDYSGVAILLRSAHAFEPYIKALAEQHIPYLAEGEKSFYRTNEVINFLNFLTALADPADRLSLVGVLRSPLGGLTDREIWELKKADGLDFRKKPPVHAEKTGPVFALMRELAARAGEIPVADLIQEIFERTWVLEFASRAYHGEQALANLFKIKTLAFEWAQTAPLTLQDFVSRLHEYREEERDEGENPLADVTFNAVKIMTIHKAKGLEFPVVILPNLAAAMPDGLDKPVVARDWQTGLVGLRLPRDQKTNAAMAIIENEIRYREEAEEVRVFYVAATRAKSLLLCLRDGARAPDGCFAEFLNHATPSDQVLFEDKKSVLPKEQRFTARLSSLPNDWDVSTLTAAFQRREKEYPGLFELKRFLSPSKLSEEPEKRTAIEDDEPADRSRAKLLGTLCHHVLEEWDFKTTPAKAPAALEKSLDRSCRVLEIVDADPRAKEIREEAHEILSGFFKGKAYEDLRSRKLLGREVPFVYALENGHVMHGIMDVLYEKDGTLVVGDYKTNRVDKKNLIATINHYRAQGNAYREAVNRALDRSVCFELIFLRIGESFIVDFQ